MATKQEIQLKVIADAMSESQQFLKTSEAITPEDRLRATSEFFDGDVLTVASRLVNKENGGRWIWRVVGGQIRTAFINQIHVWPKSENKKHYSGVINRKNPETGEITPTMPGSLYIQRFPGKGNPRVPLIGALLDSTYVPQDENDTQSGACIQLKGASLYDSKASPPILLTQTQMADYFSLDGGKYYLPTMVTFDIDRSPLLLVDMPELGSDTELVQPSAAEVQDVLRGNMTPDEALMAKFTRRVSE